MIQGPTHWLPTRPYDVTAAINRMAAATGSCRMAATASHADYNGHRVEVRFNDYSGCWIAEYFWAGRIVLARGALAACLDAAKREHGRGALGSEVHVHAKDAAEAAEIEAAGFAAYSKEIEAAHRATWHTPLHDEVNDAMRLQSQVGIPAVGFLANSKTVEEYQAKIDAFVAERKAARAARGTP